MVQMNPESATPFKVAHCLPPVRSVVKDKAQNVSSSGVSDVALISTHFSLSYHNRCYKRILFSEAQRLSKPRRYRVMFSVFAGFRGKAAQPHAAQPDSGRHRVQVGLARPKAGERQMLLGV